jgi:hypothetical protein
LGEDFGEGIEHGAGYESGLLVKHPQEFRRDFV